MLHRHQQQCVAELVTCYGTSHPSLAASCTKYPSYKFRRPRKKRLSVGTVIIIATEEQHRMEEAFENKRNRKNISKTKGMHRKMTNVSTLHVYCCSR
jgi:hypothetical protein